MTRILTVLAGALRRLPFDDVSHVHPGAIGAAPVCRDPRCLGRRSGSDSA